MPPLRRPRRPREPLDALLRVAAAPFVLAAALAAAALLILCAPQALVAALLEMFRSRRGTDAAEAGEESPASSGSRQ
ncbi:MAG: hypothetical protein ACE149_17635 [Armatimonadota bacterium]